MIDFPDSATILAVVNDRRFIAAAAVSALSGLVRGFAGFGSALIYMPLVAAIYDPRLAAISLLLIDFCGSTPFTIPEFRRCDWNEVIPVAVTTAIAVPFGTMTLLWVDPIVLRWGIAVLVLGLLAALIAGFRFHKNPGVGVTIGVGLFAGFGAGAVQIAGPAVIIYWLSRGASSMKMRANLMVYFAIAGAILIVSYIVQGIFTAEGVLLSVLLGIPYLISIGIGTLFFHGSSDVTYRRVAYVIIVLAAVLSLPVFDGLLR
ncbi:MAG: sulfite exporter TauE/SafE family protein [Pseudomonadota bacterium]